MRYVRIGAAVLNQTPLDWFGNQSRIENAIEEARRQRVSVLCLPELSITGYNCEDAYFSRDLHETALELLLELVDRTAGMIVSFGLPIRHRNGLFNSACLAVDGEIVGFTCKQHLPGDGIYYEPRWFKPWPQGQVSEVRIGGAVYPIGDLFYDCGGLRLGFEICEDAWVAKRSGSDLALRAVDVILNPSASHFSFGRLAVREGFVREGSRAFNVSYAYSNLLGNEAGRTIYDGGAMIASNGELLAHGPRFRYSPFAVTSAVVDVEATRMARSRLASYKPYLEEDDERCRRVDFVFPTVNDHQPRGESRNEPQLATKEIEFTKAIALGLFDYLRKSRSRGFVVSASGGADSSAVACLVALMVRLATADLGIERFKQALGYVASLESATDESQLIERLLTCVYQSTVNSSERTRSAARDLASALGARFLELDVQDLVEGYTHRVETALNRQLEWNTDDLALQNIQARVRGPGVWMLANIFGALLLATSNRSEAAVGYATMDGDTCGGLSPIGGIDKAFLKRWLHWLETEGAPGIEPIQSLGAVTSQDPTAELRPAAAAQKDGDDLMPYPLLDAIEKAAIRDKKSPLEVFQSMRSQFPEERFPDYSTPRLLEWTTLFFRLWCRNQWKRERYAPSFHVDDENLDPKTWCRFPILSGGFERELAELRTWVAAQSDGPRP